MGINKNFRNALSNAVSDFAESSRPSEFERPQDGYYTVNCSGVVVDHDDDQWTVDGENSLTVAIGWVTSAPIVGKQLRQKYNLSLKDKNGKNWMLRNMIDNLHTLGVYDDDFKFDREEVTIDIIEELLEKLDSTKPKGITLHVHSDWSKKDQKFYQNTDISVPMTPKFTEVPAAGNSSAGANGDSGTSDDTPAFEAGQTVEYNGRELEVVEYDDITEMAKVRKPGSQRTTEVPGAELSVV